MSEAFIRRLSQRIVTHPEFQQRLQSAVADVLTQTLRDEMPGQELRLYLPKVASTDRAERVRKAKVLLAAGLSTAAVAKQLGVSQRYVQLLQREQERAKTSA